MLFRIAPALLALTFAAACASGVAPAQSGATQAAQATSAPTSAATAAPTAAAPPAATATANPDSALIDLIRGGKAVSYKVTYTMTTTGGGQTTTATFSQASRPGSFRSDMTSSDGTITTLVRPEGTFVCGAIFGPSPICFNAGAGAAAGANLPAPPQPIPSDLTGWGLVATSGRTIAGQSTRCFSFTSPTTPAGAGVETIGCYTSEGIPLFISTKSAGTEVSMTATQFSTTVSDADFAIPYPVQKLPGQP